MPLRNALSSAQKHALLCEGARLRGGVLRTVTVGDSTQWLQNLDAPLHRRCHVVTSLPDIGELISLGSVSAYEQWFCDAVHRILAALSPTSVAIFYQTDGRLSGESGSWLDKSYLCHVGARRAGATCIWHCIVAGNSLGQLRTHNRAGYAHMLCFSREYRQPPGAAGVDLLPQSGHMSYAGATGEAACSAAVQFCVRVHEARIAAESGRAVLTRGERAMAVAAADLEAAAAAERGEATPMLLPEAEAEAPGLIVDPFCGEGSILAMANAWGFDALGMDTNRKRCAAASRRVAQVVAPNEHEGGVNAFWGGRK